MARKIDGRAKTPIHVIHISDALSTRQRKRAAQRSTDRSSGIRIQDRERTNDEIQKVSEVPTHLVNLNAAQFFKGRILRHCLLTRYLNVLLLQKRTL